MFYGGKMMDKIVVTIGRQYGSGGKKIGEMLAKELGIPCYDKELLTQAAKNIGFCEEIFETHDEKPVNSFLYSLGVGGYVGETTPLNHKLFLAQFDAIKELADKGSCVIIGRCADYALENDENTVNVFVYGDLEDRIERAVNEYDIDPAKAKEIVLKTDKKRSSYYNFYSGKKWGAAESYDLSVNSSCIDVGGTVEVIKKMIEVRISKK